MNGLGWFFVINSSYFWKRMQMLISLVHYSDCIFRFCHKIPSNQMNPLLCFHVHQLVIRSPVLNSLCEKFQGFFTYNRYHESYPFPIQNSGNFSNFVPEFPKLWNVQTLCMWFYWIILSLEYFLTHYCRDMHILLLIDSLPDTHFYVFIMHK